MRVGIIGLGVMGMRHVAAFGQVAQVELVGAADPTGRQTLEDVAVVHTLDELIALGIEACIIASPTPDHVASAVQLAGAGVHLLVEKPLALDLAGCEAVTKAVTSGGVIAAVAHVERFHPAIVDLRRRFDAADVESVRTYRVAAPPRRDDGGGVLLDLAVHDFDLTAWLTGRRYDLGGVVCRVGENTFDISATLGTVEASHRLTTSSGPRERRVEVITSRGTYDADMLLPGTPDPLIAQATAFRDLVRGTSDSDCATLDDATHAVSVALRCAEDSRPHVDGRR